MSKMSKYRENLGKVNKELINLKYAEERNNNYIETQKQTADSYSKKAAELRQEGKISEALDCDINASYAADEIEKYMAENITIYDKRKRLEEEFKIYNESVPDLIKRMAICTDKLNSTIEQVKFYEEEINLCNTGKSPNVDPETHKKWCIRQLEAYKNNYKMLKEELEWTNLTLEEFAPETLKRLKDRSAKELFEIYKAVKPIDLNNVAEEQKMFGIRFEDHFHDDFYDDNIKIVPFFYNTTVKAKNIEEAIVKSILDLGSLDEISDIHCYSTHINELGCVEFAEKIIDFNINGESKETKSFKNLTLLFNNTDINTIPEKYIDKFNEIKKDLNDKYPVKELDSMDKWISTVKDLKGSNENIPEQEKVISGKDR